MSKRNWAMTGLAAIALAYAAAAAREPSGPQRIAMLALAGGLIAGGRRGPAGGAR